MQMCLFKHGSPKVCPAYWDVLNSFGVQNKIFMPDIIYEEIVRTDDELSKWLKVSGIPIRKINEKVTECLQRIYSSDPNHKFLVDNN